MAPGTQVLLSGALTFGVPLLLAAYELVALGRASGGSSRFDGPRNDAPSPPVPGGEPQPPLPACLIEAARTDLVAEQKHRRPVLEPA